MIQSLWLSVTDLSRKETELSYLAYLSITDNLDVVRLLVGFKCIQATIRES